MPRVWVLLAVIPACSFTPGVFTSDAGNGDTSPDVDLTGGWSVPIELASLGDASGVDDPSLTADLLEIYFGSRRAGGMGNEDIWMARRASVTLEFDPPENVTELNTGDAETTAKITTDGLAIFFASDRNGSSTTDIWAATRPTRSGIWGPPGKIAEISDALKDDFGAFAKENLLHLIMCRGVSRPDESLYTSDRAQTLDFWSVPLKLSELDVADKSECDPMEPNAFTLYYASDYQSNDGTYDIVRASRPTEGDPYRSRTPVDDVNLPAVNDRDPWVSADERTMVFSSDRAGGDFRLYITTR